MSRAVPILGGAIGSVLAMAFAGPVGAAITIDPWQPLYRGIDFTTGTADTAEVRPQVVKAVRVDVTAAGIGFTATPSNGPDPLDTLSQTTSQFLVDTGARVAINTSFYTPCCSGPQNKDIIGLAVADGTLVSPAQPEARAALLIDTLTSARFVNTVDDVFLLTGIGTAFAGSNFLLGSGRDIPTGADIISPARTLVGLGDRDTPGDNGLLYLVTIDDGIFGVSDGATRRESAEWLMRLGAHTGVNLDGGGSTLMAARDPDTDAVTRLNIRPGAERSNANHLGVFAQPLVGSAAPQFTTLWFAGLPDNSVADFSPEDGVRNARPGSATSLDDDYYFAGTYPDPIGTVARDEPLENLERAVIRFDPPNDTELRFHFNLTPEQADPLTEFRYLTAIFQQDGVGTKTASIELLFNGIPVATAALTEADNYTSPSFLAGEVGAVPGANELTVRQTGGDATFTNFDFHRLDIKPVPEPGTGSSLLAYLVFAIRPKRSR